jgi:uncharacterized protein DUF3761
VCGSNVCVCRADVRHVGRRSREKTCRRDSRVQGRHVQQGENSAWCVLRSWRRCRLVWRHEGSAEGRREAEKVTTGPHPAKPSPSRRNPNPLSLRRRTQQASARTAPTRRRRPSAARVHDGVTKWMADANTTMPPAQAPRSTASERPAPAERPAPPPPASAPAPAPRTATQAPPADAPPNATARCNDGTFSMAKQHRGACSGHKGVKTWFK